MRLISLLNHYQHFPGFVYDKARHCAQSQTIEITVRPRRGSKPVCSGCHKPGPGYDHLGVRRFEFVPFWGCMVVLLYCMRRVDCRACGVRVEAVPWGIGKHQLTKAYMLFLAHWARKLSWQETALSFRSTWDKVCQSVEYVVQWGLEHRQLGPIVAIGVDSLGAIMKSAVVAGFSAVGPLVVIASRGTVGLSMLPIAIATSLGGVGWLAGLWLTRHPLFREVRNAVVVIAKFVAARLGGVGWPVGGPR